MDRLRKRGKDKERKLSFELNTSIVCKEIETIKNMVSTHRNMQDI